MPAGTASSSPSAFGITRGSGGGIESSLIMNRVSAGLSGSSINGGVDTALLALELKRHERRRNLMRHGSCFEKSEIPEEEKKSTRAEEVREKCRGNFNKELHHFSKDLEQWLKKMKCSGATGMRLENFRDIKVGVLAEDVEYRSPSLEPYPTLRNESYVFKGGRDAEGLFKGKGVIEFENGDIISGTFVGGMRQGEFRIETFRHKLRVVIGHYERDKLNGRAKLIYNDDTWKEGYFKEGILHGFVRHFDEKGRLTFLGNYKNGKPHGVCWKVIKTGGCVVGRVDEEGELTGIRVAYLFPDFHTAIVGHFSDGILEHGRVAFLKTVIDDKGIKVPIYTEPTGPNYHREIATYDFVTASPTLPDPYESQMVEVRTSKVAGGGEGLFAKKKVCTGIILAFYNGRRIRPRSWEDQDFSDWTRNAYKIFDPVNKTGTLDIPEEYRKLEAYCATLAHKTNHSFLPNAEFVAFNHPRFGIIPCLMSSHEIEAGEEVFVHYGYDLDGCPDWYEEAWLNGNYPIPDSMKSGWEVNDSASLPTIKHHEGEEEEEEVAVAEVILKIVEELCLDVVKAGNHQDCSTALRNGSNVEEASCSISDESTIINGSLCNNGETPTSEVNGTSSSISSVTGVEVSEPEEVLSSNSNNHSPEPSDAVDATSSCQSNFWNEGGDFWGDDNSKEEEVQESETTKG